MKKFTIAFVFMFLHAQAFCQSLSDTVPIKNVDVVANKNYAIENFSKNIDSLTLAQFKAGSLSELLSESGVFIKSFGAGSVATVSAQGTSAYHTQVYWNGIAINNAMLGLSDFALMPVNFADEIFISNAVSEKGNYEIGTSIHMNAIPQFENKIMASVLTGVASFDKYKTHVYARVSTSKQDLVLKYFHDQGKNNFPFTNTSLYGIPEMKQTNNKVKQEGFAADYFFKIKKKHLLSAHAWIQKTHRQNPPTMTTGESVAWQDDKVNRFLIDYTIENKITNYKLQMAWLDESINYVDSIINLESLGKVKTLVCDFTLATIISKTFSVDAGLTNSHFFAFADEYQLNREQNRASVFAKINFGNKKQTVFSTFALREEILNSKTNPLNFSVDAKVKLISNLFFTSSIASTHRQPTLNDLYWIPGGNPNLKPEKSFCTNAGFTYSYSKNKIAFTVTANAFNKYISNWIQWLPGTYGYWQPQNVYKVWARGTEESLKFKVQGLKLSYVLGGNFSYTRSTRNEKENEELNDKQLIYVPVVGANAHAAIYFLKTGIIYSINYKDTRFTTSDNNEFLEPYSLNRITAEQKISFSKKFDGALRFTVNNLFDETYQTIAYRPMPGRNYELTIQLNFKQNINQNKK